MMIYGIEFTIALLFLYGFYKFLLSKDTFFQLRRLYLIGSVLFASVLPLLVQWHIFQSESFNYQIDLPIVEIPSEAVFNPLDIRLITKSENIGLYLLIMIYIGGFIFFLTKLFISGFVLYTTIKRGDKVSHSNYIIVDVKGVRFPFSFFKFIVVDLSIYAPIELEKIILHEREHVDRKHSIDILIMEVFNIIFWFHPMIYLFKKQLRINHEFQADQRVIAQYSRKQYGHILLKQSQSGKEIAIANYFFHSFIKKRIMMMYNTRSNKINQLKYIFVFPMILGLIFLMSNCSNKKDDGLNDFPISNNADDVVFKSVEQMPMFPGCEESGDDKKDRLCSQTKMLQFIYKHVKYPKVAQENRTEGVVVMRFIIRSDGSISDIEILRHLQDGCDEAARSGLEAMIDENIKWIPGVEKGKKVSVSFTLPIKFKLADS